MRQALALLKGGLKKHPGAFALGAGTSAVRVFANVFAFVGGFGRERGVSRTSALGVVRVDVRGVEERFGWDA